MHRTSVALTLCAALAVTACGAQPSQAAPAPVVERPATSSSAAPSAATTAQPAASAATSSRTTTTAAAAAVRTGRFALGDSVLLGSRPRLKKRGFRVDAKVSRQFGAAISIVRRDAARGTLPRNVVVHLGTNGTITLKACKAVVRNAGSARRVFLVNVRVPRPWQNSNNRVLARCDAAFSPSRAVLVDWYRHSAGHPTWFGRDRVHPSSTGQARYTALIDAAVDRYGL